MHGSVPRVPFGDEDKYRLIEGYDGAYAVGRDGTVWSRKAGRGKRGDWKQLKVALSRGYERLTLCDLGRPPALVFVHRLVLEAFIGPCPEGCECCHSNGNRADNRLENLRWDTRAANNHDKAIHGVHKGERNTKAVLTEAEALELIDCYRRGMRGWKKLGQRFGVSTSTAFDVVNGNSWPHLDRAGLVVEKGPYKSLSDDAIREIRESKEFEKDIAPRFGVSKGLIGQIRRRQVYKDVT